MKYEEFVARRYFQKLHASGRMTMKLHNKLTEWINYHENKKLQKFIDEEVNKLEVD